MYMEKHVVGKIFPNHVDRVNLYYSRHAFFHTIKFNCFGNKAITSNDRFYKMYPI